MEEYRPARHLNLIDNLHCSLSDPDGGSSNPPVAQVRGLVDSAGVEPAWQDRLSNRPVPDRMHVAVLVRDGGRSRKCRRAINLGTDRVVRVSRGNKTEESNLQTLRRRCNRAKSKKLVPGL